MTLAANFQDFARRRSTLLYCLAGAVAVVLAVLLGVWIYSSIDRTPPLRSGEVISKSYDDPDEWYVPPIQMPSTQTCSGGYNKQPRICTTHPGMYIPGHMSYDGPHWSIRIRGVDEYGERERNVGVTEKEYADLHVGDNWSDAR